MTRVLVTGATGFVGRTLCAQLAATGYRVRAALRVARPLPECAESAVTGDLGAAIDWRPALEGVDWVVHAAALTHVPRPTPRDLRRYTDINARGTGCLAQAAAAAGVRRFVYLSSIKVNGEEREHPYQSADAPDPRDAYARSKLEGEGQLRQAAAASGMQAAIVRPPLVYGPGVRANFLRLMRWVDRGRPMPFGAIHNRRSLVSVWNLSDLILSLLAHSRPVDGVWLVSDGEDVSTAELVRRLAVALQRDVWLLPVPPALLHLAGGLLGKGAEVRRLCDSLTVDVAHTRSELAWSPPLSMGQGLARTASWYLSGGQLTR